MRDFSCDGISFVYPEDWEFEQLRTDTGWTVTLQSPNTAFMLIQLNHELPEPQEMIDQALTALTGDYPDLQAQSSIEGMGGEMAIGHEIEFFSMDLATTCWTRSFHGPAGTMFVLCQTADVDGPECEAQLRGICRSMRLNADE
jgi:hypothetical protein